MSLLSKSGASNSSYCANYWQITHALCPDHFLHASDEVKPPFSEGKLCERLQNGETIRFIYVQFKSPYSHSKVQDLTKKGPKKGMTKACCENMCRLRVESFDPLQTKIIMARDARNQVHAVPADAIVGFCP